MEKIDIDSFDRIVAYGCSYTAGDELLDHEVLGISFEECNKLKNNSDKEYPGKFYKSFSKYYRDKLEATNNQASWAGQLAKKLNKPFLNRAIGGSSIDENLYNMISDRSSKVISDRDLIVVGLTFPERIIHITDEQTITLHLGHPHRWPSIDTHKAGIELWNINNTLFNYYKSIFIMTKLGLNIRLQPICLTKLDDINKTLGENVIIPLQNEIADYMFFTTETLDLNLPHKCGFGHVAVEAHIELADKIYKKYFQQ